MNEEKNSAPEAPSELSELKSKLSELNIPFPDVKFIDSKTLDKCNSILLTFAKNPTRIAEEIFKTLCGFFEKAKKDIQCTPGNIDEIFNWFLTCIERKIIGKKDDHIVPLVEILFNKITVFYKKIYDVESFSLSFINDYKRVINTILSKGDKHKHSNRKALLKELFGKEFLEEILEFDVEQYTPAFNFFDQTDEKELKLTLVQLKEIQQNSPHLVPTVMYMLSHKYLALLNAKDKYSPEFIAQVESAYESFKNCFDVLAKKEKDNEEQGRHYAIFFQFLSLPSLFVELPLEKQNSILKQLASMEVSCKTPTMKLFHLYFSISYYFFSGVQNKTVTEGSILNQLNTLISLKENLNIKNLIHHRMPALIDYLCKQNKIYRPDETQSSAPLLFLLNIFEVLLLEQNRSVSQNTSPINFDTPDFLQQALSDPNTFSRSGMVEFLVLFDHIIDHQKELWTNNPTLTISCYLGIREKLRIETEKNLSCSVLSDLRNKYDTLKENLQKECEELKSQKPTDLNTSDILMLMFHIVLNDPEFYFALTLEQKKNIKDNLKKPQLTIPIMLFVDFYQDALVFLDNFSLSSPEQKKEEGKIILEKLKGILNQKNTPSIEMLQENLGYILDELFGQLNIPLFSVDILNLEKLTACFSIIMGSFCDPSISVSQELFEIIADYFIEYQDELTYTDFQKIITWAIALNDKGLLDTKHSKFQMLSTCISKRVDLAFQTIDENSSNETIEVIVSDNVGAFAELISKKDKITPLFGSHFTNTLANHYDGFQKIHAIRVFLDLSPNANSVSALEHHLETLKLAMTDFAPKIFLPLYNKLEELTDSIEDFASSSKLIYELYDCFIQVFDGWTRADFTLIHIALSGTQQFIASSDVQKRTLVKDMGALFKQTPSALNSFLNLYASLLYFYFHSSADNNVFALSDYISKLNAFHAYKNDESIKRFVKTHFNSLITDLKKQNKIQIDEKINDPLEFFETQIRQSYATINFVSRSTLKKVSPMTTDTADVINFINKEMGAVETLLQSSKNITTSHQRLSTALQKLKEDKILLSQNIKDHNELICRLSVILECMHASSSNKYTEFKPKIISLMKECAQHFKLSNQSPSPKAQACLDSLNEKPKEKENKNKNEDLDSAEHVKNFLSLCQQCIRLSPKFNEPHSDLVTFYTKLKELLDFYQCHSDALKNLTTDKKFKQQRGELTLHLSEKNEIKLIFQQFNTKLDEYRVELEALFSGNAQNNTESKSDNKLIDPALTLLNDIISHEKNIKTLLGEEVFNHFNSHHKTIKTLQCILALVKHSDVGTPEALREIADLADGIVGIKFSDFEHKDHAEFILYYYERISYALKSAKNLNHTESIQRLLASREKLEEFFKRYCQKIISLDKLQEDKALLMLFYMSVADPSYYHYCKTCKPEVIHNLELNCRNLKENNPTNTFYGYFYFYFSASVFLDRFEQMTQEEKHEKAADVLKALHHAKQTENADLFGVLFNGKGEYLLQKLSEKLKTPLDLSHKNLDEKCEMLEILLKSIPAFSKALNNPPQGTVYAEQFTRSNSAQIPLPTENQSEIRQNSPRV